jgi:hypothetical protein
VEDDIECALEHGQWETLKALGAPEPHYRPLGAQAYERLVAWDLVALENGQPVITPRGRKRVVLGSPRLWDPAS